jgi:hypothetical protein
MVTQTEWEYTADVASSINEILSRSPRLPFSRAKCERRGTGGRKVPETPDKGGGL